jgi:hypothetical protein
LTGLRGNECPACGHHLEPHEVWANRRYPGVFVLPKRLFRVGLPLLALIGLISYGVLARHWMLGWIGVSFGWLLVGLFILKESDD